MEGEVDFDPTTEEGQVDINDEEFESFIPAELVDGKVFDNSLKRRFGNTWRSAKNTLRNMWERRNPGKSVPEYLQMEDVNDHRKKISNALKNITEDPYISQIVGLGPVPEAPTKEWEQQIQDQMNESIDKEPDDFERIKEIFPNCDLTKAQIMFTEDPEYGREIIVARLPRVNSKVYVIKDINGNYFKDKNIPKTLKDAIGQSSETRMPIINDLRGLFPDMDAARLDVQAGDKGQIQVKYSGKDKWYNLFQSKDTNKLNSGLSKEIKDAIGKANLSERMKENTEDFDGYVEVVKSAVAQVRGGAAAAEEIERLKETLEEREADYLRQNTILIETQKREMNFKDETVTKLRKSRDKALRDRDLAQEGFETALADMARKNTQIHRLETAINSSLAERREIIKEKNTKEEQLSQTTQAIEDLEYEIDRQREIINNQEVSEEEKEAAQKELETIREEVAELRGQKEKIETELGLTTKEKVKRALVKYGLPLAFAVAVSSVVGVILSGLKGVGNGVKKVGKGLADMGKRMAASIPGLLGSVIGFALRAGGELLKFVGNNIWILVVAIGFVLMKKLKA